MSGRSRALEGLIESYPVLWIPLLMVILYWMHGKLKTFMGMSNTEKMNAIVGASVGFGFIFVIFAIVVGGIYSLSV